MNCFCGDCVKFRTDECPNVWSIGKTTKDKAGNAVWLHLPHDIHARNCDSYEEKDEPTYSIQREEEIVNESLKYGGKIVWN